MKSVLGALFALLVNFGLAMAEQEAFVGKWKLVEAFDEEFLPFSLPEGDFVMELRDDASCRGEDFLAASITIGNVMGTQIQFGESTDNGDSIIIERIMSTRMMPPEQEASSFQTGPDVPLGGSEGGCGPCPGGEMVDTRDLKSLGP